MGPRRELPSEAPKIHRVVLRSQVSISVPETLSESTETLASEGTLTSKSRENVGKNTENPIDKSNETITSKSKAALSSSRETLTSKNSNLDGSAASSISSPNGSKEEIYSVGRRITRAMYGLETLLTPKSLKLKPLQTDKSRISNNNKNMNLKTKREKYEPINGGEISTREEENNEKSAKKPRLSEKAFLTTENSALKSETHSISPKNGVSNHRLTRLNLVKIKLLQETQNNASDLMQREQSESKHENLSQDLIVKHMQEKIFPRPVGVLTRGKASAKECAVDEETPSLIEAKDTAIMKSTENTGFDSGQHHELSEVSQKKDSLEIPRGMNGKVNGEMSIVEGKQSDIGEESLHYDEDVLPSTSRKRGRPPGSKNKIRLKENDANIARKRGRPRGAGPSYRKGHADQHQNDISTVRNSISKRGRRRGGLSGVIGKVRGRLKTYDGEPEDESPHVLKASKIHGNAVDMAKSMGILRKVGRPRGGGISRVRGKLKKFMMGGKLRKRVSKNGINESVETESLEETMTVRRNVGRTPGGGRGRRKSSLMTRESVESHDAAIGVRKARLMQTRLPRKRGRPPGGGKWKGSLTSSLSLKRRKRMRMMNELEEPREMLDKEDNDGAKRQKKMKETIFMARSINKNMNKNRQDDGHGNKFSKHICSSECIFANGVELNLGKGKIMLGHRASDDVLRSDENDVESVHMTVASKVIEGTMEMQKGNVNADFGSKYCLVAPSPMDTGGRQMRPRPLDLMQPLLTLVEGQDQEYYDFDGGSFYRILQQQNEPVNYCTEKLKCSESSSETVTGAGVKDKAIFLPAFRSRGEPEENLQISYAIPETYIKAKPQNTGSQAEYDMDEEDEEWLEKCNETLSPSSAISADQFERMIDLLENRAVNSNDYNSIFDSFEEDQNPNSEECCICNGGENAEDNPVFRCAACHILVHQSCYGIQESIIDRKRGSWHCRKCQAVFEGRENADISCALCHKQGGALKPSTEPHKWAHVVCALYTNETYFVNPDAMEPIDGLNAANVRVKRQRRQCWLCGIKEGSVEKCSVPSCKAHFHVSCGVTEGASFELQHSNDQVISVRVYCPTHAFIASNSGARDEENDEFASFEENSLHTNENHSNSIPRRRGRKRKSRIHRKNASGPGKGEASTVNLDKTINGVEEHCMDSNPDELPHQVGHMENVMEDDLIREVNIIHEVHDNALTVPELMDHIYSYWISKREKYGGPLLHHIQQEHAAKKFGIFNSDDVEHIESINSPRNSDVEKTAVGIRSEPEIFQEITQLVVEREKLKLNIQSLSQNILKATIEYLKARGSSGTCAHCNETGLSVICTVCDQSACFYCSMLKSGFKCDSNWLASLKKFECFNCLKQHQTQQPLICKRPLILDKDKDRPGSSMSSEMVRTVDNRMFGANSLQPSLGKPYMVLPWLDFMHQHRLTTDVPWKRSPPKRTISIANLLTMPKSCFIDVP